MSFLKKLFGGGGGASVPEEAPGSVSYEGYVIVADPQQDGQQFRLAGTITKEIDGVERQHLLIRADVFSNREEAVEATFRKAKRVIQEQGDKIFG